MSFNFAQVNSHNQKSSSDTIKLVITLSSFHNVNPQDARALATILAKHINEAYNLNKYFQVETPNSLSEVKKIAGDDFDYIIVTTDEYVDLKKKLPMEPYMTNLTDDHIGYKLYLIVNKTSEIENISQLKNRTINILSRGNQMVPVLWLDKILKGQELPGHTQFFKETMMESKATNVVLPVFFNKTDACVITDASLKLITELNPAIMEGIKILNTSDYFILGLSCLNKNRKNTDTYKLLKDIIPTLHENEYGKQLLNLFNAQKLVPFKEEYLKAFYNLLK